MHKKEPIPFPNNNEVLEIKSVTWSKVSHGLFDYESNAFKMKKFPIFSSQHIFRKKDDIVSSDEESMEDMTDSTYLTKINFNEKTKQFELIQKSSGLNNTNLNEEVFIIVRSLKNNEGNQQGYQLNKGDIIKFGRIEYLILECKNKLGEEPEDSNLFNVFCDEKQYNFDSNSLQKETVTCRICLTEEEFGTKSQDLTDINAFLINPCECKGSLQYVHFGCLKSWINSKIVKRDHGNMISYDSKRFECEVCEKPYPKCIYIDNKRYDIFLSLPNTPYLLIENVIREKKKSKGIILIKMDQLTMKDPNIEIKLGRGHNCNVRITDISVSRFHAIIKYENEKFVLIDNNSKFGTLVLLKSPLILSREKIAVQIGRTVISFSLKNRDQIKSNNSEKQEIKINPIIMNEETQQIKAKEENNEMDGLIDEANAKLKDEYFTEQ